MWGFAIGILVLLALAVVFALWPWLTKPSAQSESMNEVLAHAYRLRRDELQEDVEIGWLSPELFSEAESELDRGLLKDTQDIGDFDVSADTPRRIAPVLGTVVVLAGLSLYLGSSELVRFALPWGQTDQEESAEQLQQRLEEQLAVQPEDAQGWAHLAELHRVHDRIDEAIAAWVRANALLEYSDPSALVALADVLVVANNDQFTDEAIDYLLQALRIDPQHQKALWLAGWAARQRDQTEAAVQYWERLLEALPQEEEGVRSLIEGWLAEVRGEVRAMPSRSELQLRVGVTLAAELEADLSPGATLFVYARQANGAPMPLAIWRGIAQDLPVEVVLDDSMGMAPGMPKLSQAEQVVVLARLSESGEALRRSGDLLGESKPLVLAETDAIDIVIDTRVP